MARSIRRTALFGVMLTLALGAHCATAQEEEAPLVTAQDIIELAEGNTEFALNLYGRVRSREGNLFLSPYSISSALAMTYAGARGNTAKQMARALSLPMRGEDLHNTFGALTDNLNERGNAEGISLAVANALWGQRGSRFLDEFVDLNKKAYGAGLRTVDFGGDTEGARGTINAWVKKETKEKVQELLKPGMVDASTMLVLTNAIYFKGGWASQFDTAMTREEPFWVTPDSSVTARMMNQSRKLRYFETQAIQMVELPYQGEALSMIVLLPKAVDGLATMEQLLRARTLNIWLGRMQIKDVKVSMPRFELTSDLVLNEPLQALGMKDAFEMGVADFSGMTGGKALFIGSVVHQATVDVSEEGTEAAAGTAVVMKKGPPIPVVQADHPFMFLILDNASASILFIGRVADPA